MPDLATSPGFTMKTRVLGPDRFTTSTIGLGCMGMSQGYGPRDDAASLDALARALDRGITFWDTAQSYGAGHNEQLVGRALAGRRHAAQLATKFGIVRGPDGVRLDARPATVRAACDESLARLGTDFIDLYYLHRVDPNVPVEETVGAMADLVRAGKVRHLGISECSAADLERAAATHRIAALQTEWSLWWREPEDDVIPTARRLGVGIVAHTPLGRGFLAAVPLPDAFEAGDFRAGDARFAWPARAYNGKAVETLQRLAAETNRTAGQLALGWLLAQGEDVVPIAGMRKERHFRENAAAEPLSPDELRRIEPLAARAAWAGDRRAFAAHVTARGAPA